MHKSFLTLPDIALIIVYFLLLSTIFILYANNKYGYDKQLKKYFKYAFIFKLFAGIGFALIYDFYYNRVGDTFSYFNNASRLGDALFTHPIEYFKILFDQVSRTSVYALDPRIPYRPSFRDPSVYAVHRYLSFFTIIGLKNYYITSLCVNAFLFALNWKFFVFLKTLFPDKTKIIAICILFIPSVAFWNSGLTKDPFSFSFALIFILYFYRIFFERKFKLKNFVFLLFAAYISIQMKPYILYALLAAGFLWLGFSYVHLVKNKILRVFVFPAVMLIVGFGGVYVFTNVAGMVGGQYSSVDRMLEKAVEAQYDLKQDYYQGASFDIGSYDATIGGAASVTPAAIIAGLYRPFIWEARSVVMLLSGLENLVLLLLSLYVLYKTKLFKLFSRLSAEPFLIFCFTFSLAMALGIGLSTSNFGALVRFKIPLIPFFFMGWLFILHDMKKQNPPKSEE